MTPQAELQAFIQMRQQREQLAKAANTGDPAAVQAFNTFLDQVDPKTYAGESLSPEAKALFKQKDPQTGKVMALNPETGQYDIPAKGAFSHWETWVQLGLGAALGGVAAAGIMGGAGAAAPEIATTSSGPITGLAAPTAAGLSAGAGGTTAAAGGAAASTLSKAAGLLKGKDNLLGAIGSGVGSATNAAANNRLTSGQLDQQATNAYEAQMLARAKEEQSQRNDALKQGYYANYVQNRKPGPFNPAGITAYGPDTLATATNLAAQSKAKLADAPQYDTSKAAPLRTPQQFMDKYGNPSTLEKVGNWASPTLSTLGKVLRFF